MPYCLACGKLRKTDGGFCRQCATDTAVRREADAQAGKVKIMRRIARENQKGGDAPWPISQTSSGASPTLT